MSEQQILLSPAAARGDKLSWATRIAYGGGDTACNVVFGMIGTVLTLFYTDYVGIRRIGNFTVHRPADHRHAAVSLSAGRL
ncbi:MAG: hypothetical protein E7K17_14560 [Klebsiella michiganensis]|nr:hypothetical protein [Klebsiella michiganensis]